MTTVDDPHFLPDGDVERSYVLVAPVYLGPGDYPALTGLAVQQWLEALAAAGGEPTGRLEITIRDSHPPEPGPRMVRVVGDVRIPQELADRLDREAVDG